MSYSDDNAETWSDPIEVSGFSRAKSRLDAAMLEEAKRDVRKNPDRIEIEPWRLHDLRRTVASGMARLGSAGRGQAWQG